MPDKTSGACRPRAAYAAAMPTARPSSAQGAINPGIGAAYAAADPFRETVRFEILTAFAARAAEYAAAPVGEAIRFESVMAGVTEAVDFDTPQQFQAISRDILKLSSEIPMAAEELGKIAVSAGQAGIARGELLQFTADAAKMGVAFKMSGGEIGSAITGLRAIFKLNQDQTVLLGDAYNHLSNNMDATARDLFDIANRAGPAADLFGLSGQQLGALGAAFLELKSPPEAAAAGIGSMLTKLQAAGEQGPLFQEALAGIGMSAAELQQAIGQDAQGALLDFLEAVRSSDDASATLSDLFGTAHVGGMTKLVNGLDRYKQALGPAADKTGYAGSTQAAYTERSKTTEANLQLSRNRFGRLGTTVGAAALPMLNAAAGATGRAADGLATLAERFPRVTQGVVGLTAGIGGFIGLALASEYAITLITTVMETRLGRTVKQLKGQLPALGGALKTAGGQVRKLGGPLRAAGGSMRKLGGQALPLIGNALRAFGGSLLGLATRAFPLIIGGIRALGMAVMSNPIGLAITGIAGAAFLIYKYWEPIKGFFSGLWTSIQGAFGGFWEWSKGWFGGMWESIKGFFGGIWNAVVPAIFGLWDKIKDWFGSLDMASLGRALIETLAAGIRFSPVGLIYKALKSVLGYVDKLLPSSDAQEGPLSRLTASGASIVGALGTGVRRSGPVGLLQPLTRTLGAAVTGLALTLPAPAAYRELRVLSREAQAPSVKLNQRLFNYPLSVAPAGTVRIDSGVHIRNLTIHQQPGEDPRALAERIMEEIERRRRLALREALFDVD